MEKNSDDSKQEYFSSNTNDDGKSSGVKLDWICCRMILEGFPVVNKRSARTKNIMLKWREGQEIAPRRMTLLPSISPPPPPKKKLF